MTDAELLVKVLSGKGGDAELAGFNETPPGITVNVPQPPNFPTGQADLGQEQFINWSLDINLLNTWVAYPKTQAAVAAVANWAVTNGYKIRPRGRMHNWSPLAITPTSDITKVLFVDLTKYLSHWSVNVGVPFPTATFETGITIEDATDFLESVDNKGGYSFVNMTGVGNVTLGGVLAIGGHGTSIDGTKNADTGGLGGSLSNLVTSLTAIVSNPATGVYELKTFTRDNPESAAFLVHLGRALLVEVTMRIVPNYLLQVTNHYPSRNDVFQAPDVPASDMSAQTLATTFGRLEIIWFPYTDTPWIKTWEQVTRATDIDAVVHPYPYKFTNGITRPFSQFVKHLYQSNPPNTPNLLKEALNFAKSWPRGYNNHQMHGLSRNLLIYVKDTLLRVTSFGYCLHIKKTDIQKTANQFYTQFQSLLDKYKAMNKYPVNSPVEIRYSTVDRTDTLGVPNAKPIGIAASTPISPEFDTLFWFDVLSFPGTADMNAFFAELEAWVIATWPGNARPEWSKGWAYTAAGAYTNEDIMYKYIPNVLYKNTFKDTCATLKLYDKSNLYTSEFLEKLLPR